MTQSAIKGGPFPAELLWEQARCGPGQCSGATGVLSWPFASPHDREAGIGVLAAPSGGADERQVVSLQISGTPGDGPPGEDFVEDLGRHGRGPL
jgi:hypothetical protein